jgi:histidinol phosphatase-like enzyme
MYFFDPQDFAFPRGSATGSMQIFNRDTWYSHYYMNDFVFVNNPDGTLGVYYDENQFTGSTTGIQNFTTQITENFCNILSNKFDETRNELRTAFYDAYNQVPDCANPSGSFVGSCASERFATFFQSLGLYKNVPNCYWDRRRNTCVTKTHPLGIENVDGTFSDLCCGDNFTVNFNELMTEPIANATTNEQFDEYLTTELIDVKDRKTLSAYATLRALYDRYMHSSVYTGIQSSAYDYAKMDGIANMVGTYWVDVIEQVIPATTIWGSTKIYSNTMFDQQKFTYKKGTLFTCISGPCSLDNLEFLNNCMGNIIDTFYTNECP